jgi:polyhydroxyalkanoate synthesis regulator phasin
MEHETLTKEQIESLVEHGTINGPEEKDDLAELKEQAKEAGVKGYTKMSKEELEEALKEDNKKGE